MATIVDVAGLDWTKEHDGVPLLPMEGSSFKDTFDSDDTRRGRLAWEHEGNCAYREGKWKLVKRWDRENWELYDMEADRCEMNDLAKEYSELSAKLLSKYQTWANRVGVVEWNQLEAARNAKGIFTDWMPHPHD